MSAKYKSPSFLLPNELNTNTNPLNTDGNPATGTGVNSLYSMDFDGSNNIECGNISALNGATQATWSCWYRKTATGAMHFMGTWGSSSSERQFVPYQFGQGGSSAMYVYMGSSIGSNRLMFQNTSNVLFNVNTWYHMAFVYNESESSNADKLKFYLDGTPITNQTAGFALTSLNTVTNSFDIGGPVTPFLTGNLDEVAVFNRALNTTEIAALYDGTGSNIRPSNLMAANLNPIAYYPLGEQAQNSGYPSATGNEWQFPNGVLQDYVMDFDGSASSAADFISTSNTSIGNIGSNPHTFSAWINIADHGQVQTILSNKNSNGWKFEVSSGASPDNITFYISGSNLLRATFPSSSYGSWINVVAVINGSSSKIYINGVDQSASVTGTLVPPDSTEPLIIGAQDNGSGTYIRSLNGQMSNVQIFNSALPETGSNSIETLYNNSSPLTDMSGFTSLTNWWKLNADSVYTPSAPNYTTALGFNSTKNDFDKVTVGDLTTLATPSNDITISLWAKLRTIANAQDKYGMPYSDKSGYIYFSLSGSVLKYESNLRGTTNLKDTTGIAPSELLKWHHIVVTFSGTEAKLYYNSQLLDTGTAGSATNFGEDTTIGTLRNTTNPTYSFNGFISNVAVLQSALSASQVSTLFNFGTPETNISFSPIHNWKLDNLTTGLNDTGSLASNNGTAGSVNGTGPVQESTPVAVVPSWKIPTALPIPSINYTTALDFNGNSDYIRVDNFSGVSNSFSVSLWFNLGTSALVQRNFLELMNPSTANFNQRIFMLNTGTIIVSQNSGAGGAAQLSTSGINDGKWHHLYATISSNGSIKVILDNNSTASGSSSQSFSSAISTVNIGVNFWNQSDPTAKRQYFLGQMSNVAVYNSALTDPQVSTLYNNGTPETAISFSPISWWKLDTGGSTITDYAGSNSGTNNGATKVDSNVYTGVIPVNGVSTTLPSTALQQSDLQFDSPYSNYSLSFDGINDYITISNPTELTDDFTIAAWIFPTRVNGSYEMIYTQGTAVSAVAPYFAVKDTRLHVYLTGTYETGLNFITANEWQHVAVTRTSGVLNLYRNGVEYNGTRPTQNGTINNNSDGIIGKWDIDLHYFKGQIDETAIFNTALTEAQVLEIYNNGKPGNLDNFSGTAPISWWRLGENAYFNTGTTPGPEFTVPNSIYGAPNGVGSGIVTAMLSADAPGTYANGIGDGLAITDRVGDAPLSVANSQSYNMIPDDKVPYVPGYVGLQTTNASEMTFDGVDDYFSFTNLTLPSNEYSISLWMYSDPGANVGYFLTDGNTAGGSTVGFKIDNNGTDIGKLSYWDGSNTKFFGTIPSPASWNHVAFVANVSGSTITSYINGSVDTTATSVTVQTMYNLIGAYTPTGGNKFVGKLDEVAIFDEALTPDQIKFDLYEPTALVSGVEKTADIANNTNLPTPVAWYRMGD